MCYFATAIFTCNYSLPDLQAGFGCPQPYPIPTYIYSTKAITEIYQCPDCNPTNNCPRKQNPNSNSTPYLPNPRSPETAPIHPKHGPHSGAPCVQPQGDSGCQTPKLEEMHGFDRGTPALLCPADGLPSSVPYVQPRSGSESDQHQMPRLGETYGFGRGTLSLLNLEDGPRSGKGYVQPKGD